MSSELKGLVDKLNPVCRQALEAAARHAVKHGHATIEIEHLLLELLNAGDTDLRALLRHYDVEPSVLAADFDALLAKGAGGSTSTPVFSPQLTGLLRQAWIATSAEFGLAKVRSGTILRAALADTGLADALTRRVPRLADLDATTVANDLPEVLQHSVEAEPPVDARAAQANDQAALGKPPTSPSGGGDAIALYTQDLTAEARAGRLDPVIGREREIAQTLDVLMRRRQNNPILLGAPGVGKTAIVEGLARRIAAGDAPGALPHTRVLVLDLGQMKAGAGVRGEFETRLKGLVAEITSAPAPTILFVDEAHTLIGAGGAEGQGDAANLLKPALARGELRLIGATTWREYKRYIEKDPALTRRFQPVKVDEPGLDDAVGMLRGVAETLETHHDVRIDDAAVRAAVKLSDRFIPARQLPDKAISVLDTACARVALSQGANPEPVTASERALWLATRERDRLTREARLGSDHGERLSALETELSELAAERDRLAAQAADEQALLAELRGIEKRAAHRGLGADERRRLDELRAAVIAAQKGRGLCRGHVDTDAVAEVIGTWTSIPVDRLLRGDVEAARTLGTDLAARVVGQYQATEVIARQLSVAAARLTAPGRPMGTFLLVGPTGVGKTETARALADLMFGGRDHMVTINMSEYQEPHSVAGLKGAPPGYVGYGSGGVLTEAVRRTPYNVILLDEFEKAHPDVWELFYQVFDSGSLEDSEGERVDFANTIILATTNAGADVIEDAEQAGVADPVTLIERLDPLLAATFQPALLGRMRIVPYLPLKAADVGRIVDMRLDAVGGQLAEGYGAAFEVDSEARAALLARATAVGGAGARQVHRVIEGDLLPVMSAAILSRITAGEPVARVRVEAVTGEQPFRVDVA